VSVARILGIRRVIAPIMAGVFCSAGMLAADAEHNFVKAILCPLTSCDLEALTRELITLGDQGLTVLASEGYGTEAATVVYAADVRYLGQSSELTVTMAGDRFDAQAVAQLASDFNALYQQTFGYCSDEPLELVNLRVSARGRSAHRLEFAQCEVDGTALQGTRGERLVSFDADLPPVTTAVLPRAEIGSAPVPGPLIIESYDTTIVVPPGCHAHADSIGNIIIDISEARP
jgi:N-methylhydantoinase A